MGSSQSKAVQAVSTAVANVAFTSITNNSTVCKTTTSVIQQQGITISGSGNTVDGVAQNSVLQLSASCQVNDTTNQQMQADITSMLQGQASSNSSALGDTLMSLVTALGGNSKSSTSVNTTISTNVNQLFTTNNTNSMIANYLTNQSQSLTIYGSYNNVSNITQALQLNALISMTSNSATISAAAATVSQQSNSSASTVSTDPIQEVFSGVSQVIGSVSGNWTLLAGGGLCCCCCCIVILAFLFFMFKQGNATA